MLEIAKVIVVLQEMKNECDGRFSCEGCVYRKLCNDVDIFTHKVPSQWDLSMYVRNEV